jgi:hypothetical protein
MNSVAPLKTRVEQIATKLGNGEELVDEPKASGVYVSKREYRMDEDKHIIDVRAIVETESPKIWVDCLSGVVGGKWGEEIYYTTVDNHQLDSYGNWWAQKMDNQLSAINR